MKYELIGVILIVAAVVVSSGCIGGDTQASPQPAQETTINAGQAVSAPQPAGSDAVKIPLSEISTQVKKYTLDVDGKTVRYMVVLGSDGQVRTAFDACQVCGGLKGYSQSGDQVVCNKCGRHFNIDDLGKTNSGTGCWPIQLTHRIEDGQVVISKADIAAQKQYF